MEVWGWLRYHPRDGHELGAVGDIQAGEKMCIPTSLMSPPELQVNPKALQDLGMEM